VPNQQEQQKVSHFVNVGTSGARIAILEYNDYLIVIVMMVLMDGIGQATPDLYSTHCRLW
jgi:hypothetical protein